MSSPAEPDRELRERFGAVEGPAFLCGEKWEEVRSRQQWPYGQHRRWCGSWAHYLAADPIGFEEDFPKSGRPIPRPGTRLLETLFWVCGWPPGWDTIRMRFRTPACISCRVRFSKRGVVHSTIAERFKRNHGRLPRWWSRHGTASRIHTRSPVLRRSEGAENWGDHGVAAGGGLVGTDEGHRLLFLQLATVWTNWPSRQWGPVSLSQIARMGGQSQSLLT